MKVVLPDNSELELPEGATGLDAARAIGPKLAEQAVLVRSNGNVQDLRAQLEDGQQIQILTTRDTHDPDALYVLRHSTAHLLAEAVRRLYPGAKIAIGPPIENGFYYDFDVPRPFHPEDLERIEKRMREIVKAGQRFSRRPVSDDDARAELLDVVIDLSQPGRVRLECLNALGGQIGQQDVRRHCASSVGAPSLHVRAGRNKGARRRGRAAAR